jgi:hypothetical protein
MVKRDSDDEYPPQEAEQRLKATLKAAFSMKPTPLKAIPTRHGRKRKAVKRKRSA